MGHRIVDSDPHGLHDSIPHRDGDALPHTTPAGSGGNVAPGNDDGETAYHTAG
jgi:hypothetical protein